MKRILTILILLVSINANATHYYFSATGSDAAAGTSTGTAWQTLAKFNSTTFAAGDIISFNGGDTFYGSITISQSGTSGNPITINSYGAGNATITGFTSVTAWGNLGSNIWESTSAVSTLSTCNIVSINGANIPMGRIPNTGYYTYQSAVSNTSITSSDLTGTPDWTGASVVIRKNNYVTDISPITSQSAGTLNYTSGSSNSGTANYGFYIENDARTLDIQNEWYYDPSANKIKIYSTSSPTGVQVATIDTLVYTAQNDFITFDGINFTGSNKDAFVIPGSYGLTIQNCTIDFSGKDAVWGAQNYGGIGANNFLFQNNIVNHTNNQVFTLETEFKDAIITNNTISNTGVSDGMGDNGSSGYGSLQGMMIYADSLTVSYNTIDSVGHNAINFGRYNSLIHHNYITNYCIEKMDGAAIYTWYGPSSYSPYTGQKIYNNIVKDGIGTIAGTSGEPVALVNGIYMDDGTYGVEIYNNTCINSVQAGLFLHNTDLINAHNNTIYDGGEEVVTLNSSSSTAPVRNTTFKNNIVVAKASTQLASTFFSYTNDIASFGSASSIDSNYWARPLDDNLDMRTIINGWSGTFTTRSLSGWVTYSGFDAHSNKSPIAASDTSKIVTLINPSTSSINQGVGYGLTNMDGTTNNTGTVTIPAYGSYIGIKNGVSVAATKLSVTNHNNILFL